MFPKKMGAASIELDDWCANNEDDAGIPSDHLIYPTAEASFDIECFLDRRWPETEVEDQRPEVRRLIGWSPDHRTGAMILCC